MAARVRLWHNRDERSPARPEEDEGERDPVVRERRGGRWAGGPGRWIGWLVPAGRPRSGEWAGRLAEWPEFGGKILFE
jgi:hypothetical protein